MIPAPTGEALADPLLGCCLAAASSLVKLFHTCPIVPHLTSGRAVPRQWAVVPDTYQFPEPSMAAFPPPALEGTGACHPKRLR